METRGGRSVHRLESENNRCEGLKNNFCPIGDASVTRSQRAFILNVDSIPRILGGQPRHDSLAMA